jgi:hypothetical protein
MTNRYGLTRRQKLNFNTEFLQFVSESSLVVQILWENEGEIKWISNHEIKILPEGFVNKFIGQQAIDITALINKSKLLSS